MGMGSSSVQTVWSGPVFDVIEEKAVGIHTDYNFVTRTYTKCPEVVVMAPVRDGKLGFVYQYRFGAQRGMWELPAGKVDAGETTEEAARRELREEMGVDPKRIEVMSSFFASPGISTEKFFAYYCSMLETDTSLGGDESDIEMQWIPLDQVRDLLMLIVDAKTLVVGYQVLAYLGAI